MFASYSFGTKTQAEPSVAAWLTSLPVYPVCLPPTLLRAGAPWAWTQVNSLFPLASLIRQEEQTLPESTGKQENPTDEGE